MTVDGEALADIMRADLGLLDGLSEKRMFGGTCFLLHGNMVSGISKRQAMYRVGKARETEALAVTGTAPMIHGGRRMGGFVDLDLGTFGEDPASRATLTGMAVGHAATLPPKPGAEQTRGAAR